METRQGLRITSWNVNGIRNPFAYQPWRQERTFAAMFEILEADIVVMQETKIQRKDLQDDMILVAGWDVFFSLPKQKKGYSGVAIYTRNSVCAPIRAEEGITGLLTAPNSSTSFRDLPVEQQIGGYPTMSQLSALPMDPIVLDSEGRCMILEFPAFVLIGLYCPATRDESRDNFRLGFLLTLEARIRNLVASGKRIVVTGDINISRSVLDSAHALESIKKDEMTLEEYMSASSRRLFNSLIVGGKVYDEGEDGPEPPVLRDLGREFHPLRQAMYTCWEQKRNARPGNFGSRIDYVLCSNDMADWFFESDIQEGLMGSDHCPVYARLKDVVNLDGQEVHLRDLMSADMFQKGERQQEWSAKHLLPSSGKLIPEFDRRRSIKDMFTKKPSLVSRADSSPIISDVLDGGDRGPGSRDAMLKPQESATEGLLENMANKAGESSDHSTASASVKRPNDQSISSDFLKRVKSKHGTKTQSDQPKKGQSSLIGFFKPKPIQEPTETTTTSNSGTPPSSSVPVRRLNPSPSPRASPKKKKEIAPPLPAVRTSSTPRNNLTDDRARAPGELIDPIVAKESWSRLLGKRVLPRCEHNDPCVSYVTKKAGINAGRSFYMCPRPLGPSGEKERNTEWRCGTFIWSSDWTGEGG